MLGIGLRIGSGLQKGGNIVTTTHYVRPAGGSYGTGDGTSYANAWSGFANIVWASVENNVLAVCGTHLELLTVSASNVIIIGNDPNEAGVIDGEDTRATGLNVQNFNNITITSLTVVDHTTQNLFIQGTSTGIITNNCVFNGSGNQGIQHFNTCSATHNNPTCNNNVDDGISAHDSATVVINGGTFSGNDVGVNTIDDSTTTINGPVTMTSNVAQDVWAANATTDESCVITINNSTLNNLVKASASAKVVVNNCNISLVNIAEGTGGGFFECTNSVISSYIDNADAVGIFTTSLITWGSTNIAGNVELYKCRVLNDAIPRAVVKARHTLFSGGSDMQLDFQSGSTADLAYCVFYNMPSSQFGVAFRTGVTVTNFHNCTFNGVSQVGRGFFTQLTNTAQNHIFTDLSTAVFQNTGVQTLENCCFFDNAVNVSGTVTSNNEVTTDPLIVDVTNLDFSLGAGSSCIGTGETLTDAEGIDSADWGNGTNQTPTVTTKVQGASWDIGAYIS